MAEAKVIFTFEGSNITIQCSIEDKMKDICQKYATKLEKNLNSLLFLYGGNQLNFELRFKVQANQIDKATKVMRVLVYKNTDEELICPKCHGKIKINNEKLDEIISLNNNIKETINGIKAQIDNIIKNSSLNLVNIQLKNINIILKTINDDINKNNDKIKNLLNNIFIKNNIQRNEISNFNLNRNKNSIKGILGIKLNEIKEKITLFKSDLKSGIDVYLNNEKIKMIRNDKKWEIDYIFTKDGKYSFEIVFNNIINSVEDLFSECANIIELDFSNFDTSNITSMRLLFNKCYKLKEIKCLNKFNTKDITFMNGMFQECHELEYINLSSFDTSNVTNMKCMFNKCYKLKEINGIKNFNTNKVTDMEGMFQYCNELEYLDLSSFDTSNVINMKNLFNKSKKLKDIKGINKFKTNKVTNLIGMFKECEKLEYLDLSNFDTSKVSSMKSMFKGCNNLKYLNLLNFKTNCNTENMLQFEQKNKCDFITNNESLIKLYNSTNN